MKNISNILLEPVVYDIIGLIVNAAILVFLYIIIRKTDGLLRRSFIIGMFSMVVLFFTRIVTLLASLGKVDPFASRPLAILFMILFLIGVIQVNKAINIAGKRSK